MFFIYQISNIHFLFSWKIMHYLVYFFKDAMVHHEIFLYKVLT